MDGLEDLLQDAIEGGDSSEDDDVAAEKHSNLLAVISGLGKDKNKIRKNVVPVKTVTETAATGPAKPVTVGNLLKTLTDKAIHANIKKAVSKETKHLKTLPTPLEKPQNEKIVRVAAYDKVKKEVSRWDPIVYQNRLSTEVQEFPLYQPDNRLLSGDQFAKKFKPKTPLEEQIAALLHGSKNVLKNGEELTEAEKIALSSMSLKEALERRRELGRMRALQSYQEAKARRQNKIKSKKYHRLLKREKLKKQLKEFEELQKTDPAAALEKLQELELQRIEERASLRHKNSGKWAKSQAIRSKYNTEARQALSEQLEIGRKLREKVKDSESSEDEEEIPIEIAPKSKARESKNPWLNQPVAPVVTQNVDEPTVAVGYKKFWTGVNSEKQKDSKNLEEIFEDIEEKVQENLKRKAEEIMDSSDSEVEVEHADNENDVEKGEAVLPLRGDGKEVRIRLDEALDEGFGESEENVEATRRKKAKKVAKTSKPEAESGPVEIDPSKFMVLETKKLASAVSEVLVHGDDEDEIDDEGQRMTIAEAFADDDVLAEFSEEKKKAVEGAKPKDIDLFLPGWGSWGGEGVKVNKRKRKRFIIKAPPAPQRKDQNTGNLIINEEKNDKVRAHQVSELPFPFSNVQDFESSIRAPITRTFVPETAHKKLIEPKIKTKLGQAIKPMDERSLPKNKRKNKKDVDFDEGLK